MAHILRLFIREDLAVKKVDSVFLSTDNKRGKPEGTREGGATDNASDYESGNCSFEN